MAPFYKQPGVYIEETPNSTVQTITAVPTAIPIFIGYTEKRGAEGSPLPTALIDAIEITEAMRISSLQEYEMYFGKGVKELVSVSIEEANTVRTAISAKKPVITAQVLNPSKHTMYYHMQMYFANGGGACYIISVGSTLSPSVSHQNLLAGLKMSSRYEEPTLIVFPQGINMSGGAESAYNVYRAALSEAARLGDRFVLMDCYGDDPETVRAVNGVGANNLSFGAAYHPFLRTTLGYLCDFEDLTITRKTKNPFRGGLSESSLKSLPADLQSLVKLEIEKLQVVLPPCSAIAGAYTNSDLTKGVWKAPANINIKGVSKLTKDIGDQEQQELNVDIIAGKSINALRAFNGKGILIWGARTLAGNDNEWRYIQVRRFVNMVDKSIKKSIDSATFQAATSATWITARAMVENFLITLWRKGALMGNKPEQAFFVKVGLHTSMTEQDVQEGRLIVELGLAINKPAEFIIMRSTFQQNRGGIAGEKYLKRTNYRKI